MKSWRRLSSAIAWMQLEVEGADLMFPIHPSTDGSTIHDTVFAAEKHLNGEIRFGFGVLVERERLLCQFHGASTLQRLVASRRGRGERGDNTRLKLRRERLRKEREKLRRHGVGGWKDEVREDARVAARRGDEAVQRILMRESRR